jgi:hypothetical protein
MHLLTDSNGHIWKLHLNIAAARRIDNSDYSAISSTKFSILQPDKKTFMNIMSDRNLLVAIIWTMVQPQVKEMHVRYSDRTTDPRPITSANASQNPVGDWNSALPTEFPFDPNSQQELAEEYFVSGFDGEVLLQAVALMWQVLADFFPEHRTVLSSIEGQIARLRTKEQEQILKLMPEVSSIADEEMEAVMGRATQKLRKDLQKEREKTLD